MISQWIAVSPKPIFIPRVGSVEPQRRRGISYGNQPGLLDLSSLISKTTPVITRNHLYLSCSRRFFSNEAIGPTPLPAPLPPQHRFPRERR